MQNIAHNFERITISLPIDIAEELNILKKEMKVSRSEILKQAVERYLSEHKKNKLKKAAEIMADEYKTNKELTSLTALDSEDFK